MLINLQIPKELHSKIDKELQPGEVIRWVGQPIPRFLTSASTTNILISIPWTGFIIFWISTVLGFKLPNLREGLQPQHFFALLGVPFVLVGCGMLLSPLWMWQGARRTVYLVTNKRAISIQGGRSSTVIRSYLPDRLKDIYRRERADGTGDVIIKSRGWKDSARDQRSEEIGFLGVRNPQEVENILKQLSQTRD